MSSPAHSEPTPISRSEQESPFEVRDVHAAILREKEEPQDGYEPLPFWMVTFICIVAMWGGIYIQRYSGGFKADVIDHTLVTYGPVAAAGPRVVDPMVLGQRLFTNCASCHGTTGAGVAGVYPSLVGSTIVNGGGTRMAAIIINGAQGPWQAHSGNYNNAMTGWGNQLNDEQIAAIMTYVRGSWGNTGGPVTAEDVAAVRAKYTLGRQLTFDELMAIEDTPLGSKTLNEKPEIPTNGDGLGAFFR